MSALLDLHCPFKPSARTTGQDEYNLARLQGSRPRIHRLTKNGVDKTGHGRSRRVCVIASEQKQPSGSVSLERRAVLAGIALGSSGLLSSSSQVVEPALAAVGGDVITLNNGLSWPLASFGLQVYDDATAKELTLIALECGFRNFFSSVLARNQKGFARAVQASPVPREDLFICGSVLSNRAQGFDAAYRLSKQGCEDNLKAFAAGGIESVDMIMLDYPGPDADSIRGQWAALEEMLAAGQTRSLAVSNFSPAQLDVILQDPSATPPAVNQLPYSVGFHRKGTSSLDIIEENQKRGVHVQAWAPLGGSTGGFSGKVKGALRDLGAKYGKSPQQVALRWILQTGSSFSTQTKKREHFEDDLAVFDFALTAEEMALLTSLA